MEYPPSTVGTATYAYNLVTQMTARDVGSLVLAPQYVDLDYRSFDADQPYDIVRMPWTDRRYGLLRYIAATRRLKEAIRAFQPDCIWTTNGTATRIVGLLSGLDELKTPVISCLCGSDIVTRLPGKGLTRRLGSIPQRRCYNHSAAINAVCDYLRDIAVEKAVDPERIFVSPSGIDVKSVAEFRFSRERALKDNPYLSGKRVVLTVARLTKQKRVDHTLRAIAEVTPNIPDLCYVVVGDGPEMSRLKNLIEDLGIAAHVVLKGRLDSKSHELSDLYSWAQLFVMTSVREGLANVFLEAGAFGLPCIGSNDGGTPEVILDGETGFLVSPDDVHGIAGRLQQLLLDPALCKKMGQRARERTNREFSLEFTGQTKFEILESVVGAKP